MSKHKTKLTVIDRSLADSCDIDLQIFLWVGGDCVEMSRSALVVSDVDKHIRSLKGRSCMCPVCKRSASDVEKGRGTERGGIHLDL